MPRYTKVFAEFVKQTLAFIQKAVMCPTFYLIKHFAMADYTELCTTTVEFAEAHFKSSVDLRFS